MLDSFKYDPVIGKNADVMSASCECEHASHFEDFDKQQLSDAVRPGKAHDYGAVFDIEDITRIRTALGIITVCAGCAEGCHK